MPGKVQEVLCRLWAVLERNIQLLWLLIVVKLKHLGKKQTFGSQIIKNSNSSYGNVVVNAPITVNEANSWNSWKGGRCLTFYMWCFLGSIEPMSWLSVTSKSPIHSIRNHTPIISRHEVLFVRFNYLIAAYCVITSIVTDPVCLSCLYVRLRTEDWIAEI